MKYYRTDMVFKIKRKSIWVPCVVSQEVKYHQKSNFATNKLTNRYRGQLYIKGIILVFGIFLLPPVGLFWSDAANNVFQYCI